MGKSAFFVIAGDIPPIQGSRRNMLSRWQPVFEQKISQKIELVGPVRHLAVIDVHAVSRNGYLRELPVQELRVKLSCVSCGITS